LDSAHNLKAGAFVHWNIDNDNRNTQAGKDLLGRPLPDAPVPDYTETAASVQNEDDLKPLVAGLIGIPDKGIVTLKRSNANIRVWRSEAKGPGMALLVENNEKTWNLANAAERNDFLSLWPA
jgi:hypothetical protein